MGVIAKTKRAWVISWKNATTGEDTFVSILSSRYSGSRIKKLVEQVYADQTYTWEDRVRFAQGRRYESDRARFFSFRPPPEGPGSSYAGMIECGHNPFLYARLVTDVVVKSTPDGDEEITWKEPKLREIEAEIMRNHRRP